MKGIILAGGSGTRLYPLTKVVSKQLLPVYDKPMIYYPLSVLMNARIKDILIITTPQDIQKFKSLLGNGSQYGINLSYKTQDHPDGLAQAFVIGEEFIGCDDIAMILGDNIFVGYDIADSLKSASIRAKENNKATIFGYKVEDPRRFGVVELDKDGTPISIEEKPVNPKSNYCVTGLYFYPNDVISIAKNLKPSARGELEITDVNRVYLNRKDLYVDKFGQGFAWFDVGTYRSLTEASNFIMTLEKYQNRKVADLESIAFKNGWIEVFAS